MRFARAKGSKASNEKLPEDSTPWVAMKKQMLDAREPKVEPIQNVNDYLKEDGVSESTTWAEFDQTKSKKRKEFKNRKRQILSEDSGLQKKRKQQNCFSINDKSVGEVDVVSPMPPRKKKTGSKSTNVKEFSRVQNSAKGPNLVAPVHVFGMKPIKESKNTRDQRVNTRLEYKTSHFQKQKFVDSNRRNARNPKNQAGKRDPFIIKLGHKEVELRYYDGFPVKTEDWQRLTKLEEELKKKNVPIEQIQVTMKLQRRRAEKALTRERKKVCFVCREPGHLLSECPSVGESSMGKSQETIIPDADSTGFCYKCGSLEHTHLDCKVVLEDSFKFAKCFVCGEQGHITRQCPENPRGLYPKGGGCAECGDVTHFRRDCPKYQKEKHDNVLTVETLKRDDAVEALDGESNDIHQTKKKTKKTKKKVVMF